MLFDFFQKHRSWITFSSGVCFIAGCLSGTAFTLCVLCCRQLAMYFPDKKMLKVSFLQMFCLSVQPLMSVQSETSLCESLVASTVWPHINAVWHWLHATGPGVTLSAKMPSSAVQLMHARRTLKDTCEALLRQVRQQIAATNGAAPAGKPERGVAPGSFLHHLATAKHHPSIRNGDDFTDMEILQQAFGFLLVQQGLPSTSLTLQSCPANSSAKMRSSTTPASVLEVKFADMSPGRSLLLSLVAQPD